jgi:hypothetical protein
MLGFGRKDKDKDKQKEKEKSPYHTTATVYPMTNRL